MADHPLVEIWNFRDAPKELRSLSTLGGDEDFVVVLRDPDFDGGIDHQDDDLPRGMGFFDYDNGFLGRWFWERHELDNGEIIWIGAHS